MDGTETNVKIQNRIEQLRERFEKKIEAVRMKGAEKIGEITKTPPDPSDVEAALGITFEIKWRITSIKFDIPKFSMSREVIKFDIPEVRMKTEEIKFDVPSTRMVNKCIAKKPEIYHWTKIKWTCIYAKVPEVYMKRISIKIDIPKFNSKRVEIKFDKPVINMETIEIKLHLPQFYLKDLDVQINEYKRNIEDIASEMTSEIAAIQNEMKATIQSEITSEIDLLFNELRSDILNERDNICKVYDDTIEKTKTAIKILKENNAINEVASLEEKLSSIVSEYQKILEELDATIINLNEQEEVALRSLVIG